MRPRYTLVLEASLMLLKPLVALLLRHGVAYPAFAAALKKVFVEAAKDQLRAQGATLTDSAISLRSGIHRRDVREMTRPKGDERSAAELEKPLNMITEVVARWLGESPFAHADGSPRVLPRTDSATGFDALVARVSNDIRPRAVLDELVRLDIAVETADGIKLLAPAFAPRQGFAEMSQLLQANLHDHLAAASQNLEGEQNFLEQAVFVDQITEQSARRLHVVSAQAWRQASKTVMQEAVRLFDHDKRHADEQDRTHRARFGAYFFSQPEFPDPDRLKPAISKNNLTLQDPHDV